MKNFRFFLGAALTSLLVSFSAAAEPADKFVEARHVEFVNIVKSKGSFNDAIDKYFDATTFTKRCFGSLWDEANTPENADKIAKVGEKLKELFHRKLKKKLKAIKDYELENTHVENATDSVEQVDTKAKKAGEKKDVELSYFVSTGENRKFVDVAVEHASPSSKSYHKAFKAPFKEKGIDGVLEYLDKQLKKN